MATSDYAGSSFGSVIKARRLELGLTQRALAERLNAAPAYISYIEHNLREPSRDFVVRLAEILQLTPDALFPSTADLIIASRLQPAVEKSRAQAWVEFIASHELLKRHRVTARELKLLQRIRTIGIVVEPIHFLLILQLIRKAQQSASSAHHAKLLPSFLIFASPFHVQQRQSKLQKLARRCSS